MTVQSKKQGKVKQGFIIRNSDAGKFSVNDDAFKKIAPESGLSYFERQDTKSFSKYVKENYKNGQKISVVKKS